METPLHRIKYPLTIATKAEAKRLVHAWDKGEVDQYFELYDGTAGHTRNRQFVHGLGTTKNFSIPAIEALSELGEYKLISFKQLHDKQLDDHEGRRRFEVLLLQELRNAVASDFSVSEFFLTTSAVGTIIHGDLVLREGSQFQAGASVYGNVSLNIDNLPSELRRLLGPELLQFEPDLAGAINDLESDDSPTRVQKLGRVVSELGRCLQHTANAGAIVIAVGWVHKVLTTGIIS